ncbi:SYMPK [Symbiodinium sp. CCMP2456]|nr:SYMPK [Symbiodinium sp. CCMP2456]
MPYVSEVQELALKAEDASESQRVAEQLRRLQDKARILLHSDNASLLAMATRWAVVVILSQTASPLLLNVRLPAELRGISCIQDLPSTRMGMHSSSLLEPVSLQQQAEELFELLLKLLRQAVASYNDGGRAKAPQLIGAVGAVARQRPSMLPACLDVFKAILLVKDALGAQVHGEIQKLVAAEIQLFVASGLTAEWSADLLDLFDRTAQSGSLEELSTRAKYKQISMVTDDLDVASRATKRARRTESSKHVWTWQCGDGTTAEDVIFDADALLSGEAESTCRRLEDYFGLPSQREPAGHVPGPAVLATKISSQAELARIALTSLSSLSVQRSLHRERAHENAVAFSDPVPGHGSNGASEPDAFQEQLSLLIDGKVASRIEPDKPEEPGARDPRAALPVGVGGSDASHLVPMEIGTVQLPKDVRAKDALQLKLYEEVLASWSRMDTSLLKCCLLPSQLAAYEQVSRQVALHLAAGPRTALKPDLQRSMCQAYVLRTFDSLKASLQSANKVGASAAMDQLVELFYAKFSADVARFQESAVGTSAPLREILEAGGSSRRLAGTSFTYAELFDMCLAEFEKRDVPRRELRNFLGELPAVPVSAFRALEAQCQLASARKMALLTILALIEGKPACRWRGLQLLLKLAFSSGEDSVRFDTIRLIINKIYVAPRAAMRWQLPHLTDEEALLLMTDGEGTADGSSWDLSDPDFLPLLRLRGRCIEDVATIMLRSVAAREGKEGDFRHKLGIPFRLEQTRADLFKGAICAPKDRVWLYLALCIKRPILMHGLVETFIQCDAAMKDHLINSIEEAVRYIPVGEQELLVLVQKATPQTEALVLKMLNIMMTSRGKEPLLPGFGEAVVRLYKETQNPRLLVPVFDMLDRNTLLDFLPSVLQLEADLVTDAFRLVICARSPPLSVTELLTELHHINSPGENIVPIQSSMQALNIVFGMRDQFDPKVYGIVIQSLVEEPGPLPQLFMRTVIQVVKELPRLSDFVVVEILPRLVRQEVWGDERMWRGFMIVLQHTFASQSTGAARVLSMLPLSQLEDVLVQHPDWKAQLREFVARQPPGMALKVFESSKLICCLVNAVMKSCGQELEAVKEFMWRSGPAAITFVAWYEWGEAENANWEQGLEATRSAASDCMVHQISRMHAAMNQVLSHERARHASEISLILRRVEKDLKDTFHQVGNTVRGLAEKVHSLTKQVEAQNKALEEKEFASSQVHPDVHILRQSDQSEYLDAHCEDATPSFQWVEERELALRDEIAHLRSKLRSYEHGQKGFLPQMAKMSSSWMRHTGKERIPEAKVYDLSALLRKPEAVETEVPIAAPSWPARPVAKCKASGEDTWTGPARQTRRGLRIPKQRLFRDVDGLMPLLEKALPPLCLLSDVFSQLRNSGCFGAVTLTTALEMSAADAHSVLSNIVFLFRHAAPKLQGLSSLVLSLQEMSRLHVETEATPPVLGRGRTQGVREDSD